MTSQLEFIPSAIGSNGQMTLVAKLDGVAIHVNKLDLAKAEQRAAFLEIVCRDSPGFDVAELDAKLCGLAAEMATLRTLPSADTPELNISRIARPELFFTSEVAGIAIPALSDDRKRLTGFWKFYLRWSDGKRESRILSPYLDLSGPQAIWFSPLPTEPDLHAVRSLQGWTESARHEWVQATDDVDAATVYRDIARAIDRLVEFPTDSAPAATAVLTL